MVAAGGPAAVARGVRLLFRASRTALETCVAFVSPPAALRLSVLALGVFAEFVAAALRLQLDVSLEVDRPFGDPHPGLPRSGNGIEGNNPDRSASRGLCSPSAHEVGESTRRRLAAAGYGAARAVLHDFSGLLLT